MTLLAATVGTTASSAPAGADTGAAASPPAATAPAVLPYQMQVVTLDNGLRMVLVPFPSPGIMAYYTLVRTGAREEVEKGHSGFAHLFEHMMFRGSKNFPQEAQEALVKRLGLDDNAWTSEDETVYTLYGPVRALPEIMKREADRFQNLQYSVQTFQTETKAVLGEYNKSASDPLFLMEEKLLEAVFKKHTYGHTVIGYKRDIETMVDKFDYSLKFLQRFYRPDNFIVFVVGDFNAAQVVADAKRLYGTWTGKTARVKVPPEPPQKAPKELVVDWPTPTQTRLMIAYRTPAGYDAAAVQEVLGLYLLGPTSRLHKDLVLDRQLVEAFGNWYRPHRDPRLFIFIVTLKDREKIAEVRKAIDAAFADLRAGKVDDKLFGDAKSHYRFRALVDLETPNDLAGHLAAAASSTGDPDALERLLNAVGKLEKAALVSFAQKHFIDTNRSVVTLRPTQ